jgi:plastocyanin
VKTPVLLACGAIALGAGGNAQALRAQVVAREFSFQLSRTQLSSGLATIELANFGEDAHDLRVQRIGATHIAGTPVVQAGGRAELTLKLRPGRYRYWCSLANHRALGMRGVLVVR